MRCGPLLAVWTRASHRARAARGAASAAACELSRWRRWPPVAPVTATHHSAHMRVAQVLPVVTASAWRPREQGSAHFNAARKRLGAPRRIAARSNETARRLHPAANSATLGVHSLLPFIKMKRVAEAAPRVLAVCDVELVHAVAKALVEAGLTDGSQSAVVIPTTGSAVTGEEHPYFGSVFHADVRPARDYDREYLGRQVGGRKYDFALVACPEALVPFMDGSCRGTEQGSEASSAESRSGASLSPGTDRLVSIASHLLR